MSEALDPAVAGALAPFARPYRFQNPQGNGPRCQLEPLPDDWAPRPVDEITAPFKTVTDDELLRALCGDTHCAGGTGELYTCEQPLECTRPECHDDDGPSDGPRCLPGRNGGLVEGQRLRGGRQLARPGPRLPGWARYLAHQLDGFWRALGLRPRVGGDSR